MRVFIGVFAVLLAAGIAPAQEESKDDAQAASVKEGLFFYEQFCILCHGPNGMGSFIGPSLSAARAKSLSDAALRTTIADGTSRGMPSFGRGLTREEMDALVIYIRSLQERPSRRGSSAPTNPVGDGGDYKSGEELFYGKARCAECHTVTYRGGTIGPDLSHIATEKEAGEIYEAITEPDHRVTSQYKIAEFQTKSGEKVRGIFRGETDQVIQVLNAEGNLWRTYMKAEITDLNKVRESPMPKGLLDALSDAEKRDLMTYLLMQQ